MTRLQISAGKTTGNNGNFAGGNAIDHLQNTAFRLKPDDIMSAIVVGTPGQLLFDSFAKRQGQNHSHQQTLAPQPGVGTVAGFGEKRRHNHRQLYVTRVQEVVIAGEAKKINQITALPFIPPAEKLDFHTQLFQSGFSLFDFGLQPAMSQKKRMGVIV
ncbi:MAG: hypothetical protein ABSD77_02025 [Verrucomicrobiota bacterium]